jgi:hypothetical protein
MIQPLDVALLAAIWRELERALGDESEAAWAVWERMKSEPVLCNAWLRHVEPVIDNRLELSKLAEEALRVTARGDEAAAERAFRELIDSRENPATAKRVSSDFKLIVGVFVNIVRSATEAWRREHGDGQT